MRKLLVLLIISVLMLVVGPAALGQSSVHHAAPETVLLPAAAQTDQPTVEPPTDTSVPPTNTTVPPSDTPVPPTDTSEPPTLTTEPPTLTTEPPTLTIEPPTDTSEPPPATTEPPPVNTAQPTATYVYLSPVPTRRPTSTPLPPTPPGKLDGSPRIAVISAYAPEITALLDQTTVENTYTVNGVEFTTGTLAGNQVVLYLSGVSMVNAAMNTQLGLDHFNITHIVFSGIAGGVNPDYHIGDVVIAAQWAQYQESIAARETSAGVYTLPSWATAPFANYGFWFPQDVTVRSDGNTQGEDKFWFAVDPQMFAIAQTIAAAVKLNQCTPDNTCLADAPQVHVGGNGVSGPTFVDNADYRSFVYQTFDADALDEETASAATVAYANGVPFIAFRSLSDLAGGGPGENGIGTFFQLAADNSASVTSAFLQAWADQ